MNKTIVVNCIWEHNGNDTLLYATDYIGAYARGENLEAAMAKIPQEIASYCIKTLREDAHAKVIPVADISVADKVMPQFRLS